MEQKHTDYGWRYWVEHKKRPALYLLRIARPRLHGAYSGRGRNSIPKIRRNKGLPLIGVAHLEVSSVRRIIRPEFWEAHRPRMQVSDWKKAHLREKQHWSSHVGPTALWQHRSGFLLFRYRRFLGKGKQEQRISKDPWGTRHLKHLTRVSQRRQIGR